MDLASSTASPYPRPAVAVALVSVLLAASCPVAAEDGGPAGKDTFVADVLAIEADPAFGEYLSSQCATCHGSANGQIPGIAGLPADYFVGAIHEYRTGVRDNDVMRSQVGRLSEEEIAALAAFYSKEEAD